jgi:fused signal recognition particle receptor
VPLVVLGIFVLAVALILLGLGLSRRATRRESRAAEATGAPAVRAPGPSRAPAAPAARVRPRLRDRLAKTRAAFAGYLGTVTGRPAIDDQTWDDLEEMLLRADVGVPTTSRLLDDLRSRAASERITEPERLVDRLRDELVAELDGADRTLRLGDRPSVWLFVGVNGVGKTTTIAKVAAEQLASGRGVLLAAADTFRAAAADQLGHWGERLEVPVVRGQEGADPGSVVYDAISAAAGRGVDVVLVDTAGRMHTKVNLMAELQKLRRIVERTPGAMQEVLLVVDASTGQNGLNQARQFAEAADVTGVVLTKLDGTAKGGIVLAIESDLGIPVKLVGVGESPDDLVPFAPREFVDALFQ